MHDAEKLIEICNKTGELDDTSEYQIRKVVGVIGEVDGPIKKS